MKLSTAWANVTAQNVTLKAAIVVMGFCSLTFAMTSIKLALRQPLVIERGCFSTAARVAATEHSAAEVETFVKEALRQRFDSTTNPSPGFLSREEEDNRLNEEKELSTRNMSQKIVVNSMNSSDKGVSIDATRLIYVGTIRSAFSFPLNVKLSSVTRSEANPYGLILSKVEALKDDEKKAGGAK